MNLYTTLYTHRKILFIGAVIAWLLYIFLLYVAFPISGDAWYFSAVHNIHPAYSFRTGIHPGRQFGEFLNVAFTQGIGFPLGGLLNDPIMGIRIGSAIGSVLIIGFATWVTSRLLPYHQKIGFILFVFLYFFLPLIPFSHSSMVLQVFGGYSFALFSMLYVYKQREEKEFDFFKYGIWLVICYTGSQITEGGYFVVGSILFTWLFLPILQKLNYIKDNKFAPSKSFYIYILTYLVYCVFSFARTYFFGTRASSVVLDINLGHIYERLIRYVFFIDLTLAISLIVMIYLLVRFFTKKSNFEEYITLSMFVGSVFTILVFVVMNGYFDQALWMLWIALIRILLTALNNKNRLVFLCLPTLFLWIVISAFIQTRTARDFMLVRSDYNNVEFFKNAEKQGLSQVFIDGETLHGSLKMNIYNFGIYPNPTEALKNLGIINNVMSIQIKPNENEHNNNINN